MTRTQAVLVTLIVYKVVLVAIGIICQRRTHDGADFFLGGRKLGPLVAAISASASSSSAWTLLGVSGAAYAWGAAALWIFPSCVGGFLVNWFILAPALRDYSHRTGALTVTEILAGGTRPGSRGITRLASLIVLLSLGTYVASQFQGAGKAFSETFNLSYSSALLLGSGIVIFYTLLGGFWAVSVTDTLQGLLMGLSAILLPLVALFAVGGTPGLVEGLQDLAPLGYLDPTRGLPWIPALGFVFGLLGIGFGYPGQPHVVNRFMAMREGEGAMRRGRLISISWAVIVYAGMLLLGLCGRILFPGLDDREVIFLTTANTLLPPVMAGILVAAILSAIMSTVDSQLLVAASAVTHDLGLGGRSTKSFLVRSRLVIVLLSLGAIAGALWGNQEIFSKVLFAWSAMGSAFGPLLLVTVLRGRVRAGETQWAMFLGFALSAAAYWYPETRGTAVERIFPFLVAFVIAWHGSRSD